MTLPFWILLFVVAAAIAVATMRRKRPAARISDAARTPRLRDGLSDLGISDVRPVSTHGASPAAVPAREPETPREWIEDVLDVPDASSADTATASEGARASVKPLARHDSTEAPEAIETAGSEETVWTFDAEAVSAAPTRSAAYVRPEQTLWPDADAVALLAGSMAARLGGSVAVVQQIEDMYQVELLVGPARVNTPAAMPAADHPLSRVPRDGVLSLLADGAESTLTYHADPSASVGQALAQSFGTSAVFVVADLPPTAPDIDDATALLVSQYAGLLTRLTDLPEGLLVHEPDEQDEERAIDSDSETWEDALVSAPDVEVPYELDRPDLDMPDADLLADLAEDADTSADPAEDEIESEGDGVGDSDARAAIEVATPGARRPAPPPPPRAVILNAEIDAARRDHRLLVFALVTLADAETVLRSGADDMVRAEAALRQRLSTAPAVRRVEPFGDLVFGAFLDAEGPEVVAWAERISRAGEPILVGAVPASGSADAVRASATAALQHAYETEAVCVVAS